MRNIVYPFGELEHHISRAEIFYKTNKIKDAIASASRALELCASKPQKQIALKIFLAKCYAKIGDMESSNNLYRTLIDEKVYMTPIIMGLMHNNISTEKDAKVKMNMDLIKILLAK
ncbi:MAG: hypothetical protein FWE16_05355 [Firmicutes bacterium]|nr:hypothetical protein [Bacillota bacterium]